VTREESVDALVKELIKREGRTDVLVNNAGFGVAPAGAEESSIEQARAIFDTNFFGIVRMTRAVVPHMRKQGAGRIVNISSILGLVPAPYMAVYSASKHAVEGYSESLDHEVRGQGIRVVLVEPAYTRTAFDANLVSPHAPLSLYDSDRAGRARFTREVMATADAPEIVAEVVVKAATAAAPHLRYTAGSMARQASLLRRFVPAKQFDKSYRKQMRLPPVS
jgi:short-subunit dehydrogenase